MLKSKPAFFTLLLLIFFSHLKSQSFYKYQSGDNLQLIISAGFSNYNGEISSASSPDTNNPNVGVGAHINLAKRIGIRSELMWYRISADDSESDPSEGRVNRNLSFRSDNFELSLAPVLYLFPEKQFPHMHTPFNIYFTAGIGITYFNPKANHDGKWHSLRPLKTEGVEYGQIAFTIPSGIGLQYRIKRNLGLGIEASYHYAFTDYLDDISTEYQARSSFADPLAVILADRRPELGLEPAPDGSQRGNPEANDGFLIFNFKVHYYLHYGNNFVRRIR